METFYQDWLRPTFLQYFCYIRKHLPRFEVRATKIVVARFTLFYSCQLSYYCRSFSCCLHFCDAIARSVPATCALAYFILCFSNVHNIFGLLSYYLNLRCITQFKDCFKSHIFRFSRTVSSGSTLLHRLTQFCISSCKSFVQSSSSHDKNSYLHLNIFKNEA